MTSTIHNPAGIRRLVVGLWTISLAYRDADVTTEAVRAYFQAAHLGLQALGADVPSAPFGLQLIVSEELDLAGPKPSATSPTALAIWREHLTDDIMRAILPKVDGRGR